MQHVCFLISILYFLNIHSCNIWIILQQLLILKLFWQNNAIQDLTKEFAAAALSNQYIRVLAERRRNNPGNAFMRNFSAGGKSGPFFRPKKKFGIFASSPSATNNLGVESHFLPIDHIQQTKIKLEARSVERVCHGVWIQISVLQWLTSLCLKIKKILKYI